MPHHHETKKAFVAVSGGVDSAVSAALLKEEGYDVTGVFIRIWSEEWRGCPMKRDRLDAMRVCAALDIPFREVDSTDTYRREVLEPSIAAFERGETPNPDVLCNRAVKFGDLFRYAMDAGADIVATGHYARTGTDGAGCATLRAAADSNKDQTYFLWMLTAEELARTRFPVGGMDKPAVRRLASRFTLPVATKPDSQGLCFLGDLSLADFVAQRVPPRRGDVLNEKGAVIGFHEGAHLLTVGSRHGFTVTEKSGDATRLYIVAKNISANSVTVAPERLDVSPHELSLAATNWVSGVPPIVGEALAARFHHRGALVPVTVVQSETHTLTLRPNTDTIERVAPGQSVVLYRNEECLGGGILSAKRG